MHDMLAACYLSRHSATRKVSAPEVCLHMGNSHNTIKLVLLKLLYACVQQHDISAPLMPDSARLLQLAACMLDLGAMT